MFLIQKKMKKHFLLIFPALFLLIFVNSCDDALDNLGANTIGSEFVVGTDTIYLSAEQGFAESMFYNNDTLMLGEFFDRRYGTIKAEALVEVLPNDTVRRILQTSTVRWKNPEYEELILVLNKTLLNGSLNSPLKISVYRNDTLTVTEKRYTNINVDNYFSEKKLLVEEWIEGDSYIRLKLPDSLGRELFNEGLNNPETFRNSKVFRDFFKGLYLTTSGGRELLFNLLEPDFFTYLDLRLIYSFRNYEVIQEGAEPPTTPTRKDSLFFSGRSIHPKAQFIKNTISWENLDLNQYGYVTSPAGLRPTIEIDLPHINEKLGSENLNINKALLSLQIADDDVTTLPLPARLLLIQKDSLKNFFEDGKIPDNRTSFLGDRVGNRYVFNIARYIHHKRSTNQMGESDEMVVVPVSASSGYFREKLGASAVRFYNDSIQISFIFNQLNSR